MPAAFFSLDEIYKISKNYFELENGCIPQHTAYDILLQFTEFGGIDPTSNFVAEAINKYVTVTGNRCEDFQYRDRTQELQALRDKFMRRPEASTENAKNSNLGMEQLLQLAKGSKNGTAFTTLWNGSQEGYSSSSEADLARCSHLTFWTGWDAAKMDTIFRRSGLMRGKWDRQQSAQRMVQSPFRR